MFKVLQTSVKTLISIDEVVYASPTMEKVDSRQINAAIQIAEERFIKPVLCKTMYYDFRDKKNVVVDAINKAFLQTNFPPSVTLKEGEIVNAIEFVSYDWYKNLWNEYLWKIAAEAVTYIATPTNYSRFSAQGEMVNNPKNPMDGKDQETVDLATIQWKMTKLLEDRIDPLRAPLEEWLYDNRGYFPLMDCKNWDPVDTPTGISFRRKTGFVFGVYDDNNSNTCGCSCKSDNSVINSNNF